MDDQRASLLAARPWREALLVIGATFIASRILLVLIALVVEFALPLDYARPSYSSSPILASLTGSDSVYLLGIAANGYHGIHAAARVPITSTYTAIVSIIMKIVNMNELAWRPEAPYNNLPTLLPKREVKTKSILSNVLRLVRHRRS